MTRKELTEEYKNLKFKMGVFQIRNTINNNIFIDGSSNLDKIWNRHRTELDFGGHRNKELQQDWKAYREENFVFEIMAELEEQEGSTLDMDKEIKLLTQMYMEELQPYGDKGYHQKSTR